MFVDGGIHWGNTYLREAYGPRRAAFYAIPDSSYRGDISWTAEQMQDLFSAAHQLGWQLCCHVTGDAGVDRTLDALEAADRELPVASRRFTITHAYFPTPEAVERAGGWGFVSTRSPIFTTRTRRRSPKSTAAAGPSG